MFISIISGILASFESCLDTKLHPAYPKW